MEIRILGPLRAVMGARSVRLGGRRAQTVLAALALEVDHMVAMERLIDVVWDAAPPESARTQVAISVSALRRAMTAAGGDRTVIETVHGGYRLCGTAVDLDTRRVDALICQARAASDTRAAELYRTALALWRGPALAGLAGPFLNSARMRWEETRLTVLEELAAVELRSGRHRELAPELMAIVAEHPYRERPRAQLMTALSLAGRRADALEVYRDARRVFAEELGLEPGDDLRDLHSAILRGDPVAAVPRAYGMVCGL